MYIVQITNGTTTTTIHGANHKLLSGTVVQGINTIDSFQFSVLYNNPAFQNLNDFTTLVSVYNDRKNRYEFRGRVLYSTPSMSESGLIVREAICESFLGFLCDSVQEYVAEQVWTGKTFLEHVINCHNSQLEEYKHFKINVDDSMKETGFTCAIERENTWEIIKKNLLDNIGGEIKFDVVDDEIILYYFDHFGETKETEIALSKNMKSITKESDPSSFITRLIPLGAKVSDDSEERIDMTSLIGVNYLDDAAGIQKYGLHIGCVIFEDATTPGDVWAKGSAWLRNNNKVLVKYSITALDLSLKGLEIDDFQIYNYHPVKNKLLTIYDVVRISKKTIDVCEEVKSSFEIGDSFKALSQIQREQKNSMNQIASSIGVIVNKINNIDKFVTNEALDKILDELVNRLQDLINQTLNKRLEDYVTEKELDTKIDEAINGSGNEGDSGGSGNEGDSGGSGNEGGSGGSGGFDDGYDADWGLESVDNSYYEQKEDEESGLKTTLWRVDVPYLYYNGSATNQSGGTIEINDPPYEFPIVIHMNEPIASVTIGFEVFEVSSNFVEENLTLNIPDDASVDDAGYEISGKAIKFYFSGNLQRMEIGSDITIDKIKTITIETYN